MWSPRLLLSAPPTMRRVPLRLGFLELAGVILLMALFGAVVLARRQMQMAEDERRAAAGMPRIGEDSFDRGGAA